MTRFINIDDTTDCVPYRLIESLVSILTDQTTKGDLSPFERLYILHSLSSPDRLHQRRLAALYMECGCFSEAKKVVESVGHWRKLGDLAWVQGDLAKAERCYSKPEKRDGAVFRKAKDCDRLIKLFFSQSRWKNVIAVVHESSITRCANGKTLLAGSQVSLQPYLKMFAVAVAKTRMTADALSNRTANAFTIPPDEWGRLVAATQAMQDDEIVGMQNKCAPSITKTQPTTLQQAMDTGATARAVNITSLLRNIESTFRQCRSAMKDFFREERLSKLSPLLDILATFSHEHLCKTYIDYLVEGQDAGTWHSAQLVAGEDVEADYWRSAQCTKAAPKIVVQFYESHPLIRRKFFDEILSLKFANSIPLSASDVRTALLQSIGSIDGAINAESRKKAKLLEFKKIVGFSEWTELKIEIWLSQDGKQPLAEVIDLWNNRKAAYVTSPFGGSEPYHPRDPREMIEWKAFLNTCHKWLTTCWQEEMADEKWVAEKILYELVKKRLKGWNVVRHARPFWLEPQHLDIFIPELSLAIEYMGEQHYAPVDFFGGRVAFEATVLRDKRKASICSQTGVDLFLVRFDDKMESKLDELMTKYMRK